MWLFFAFVAVPLIEIALFIQIGGAIGLGMTLLVVVATAMIGTFLVRTQGIQALDQIKNSFTQVRDPSEALAHGAMILFAGALLLTPGFFTDAVGFAFLIPTIRMAVFNWARKRVSVTKFSTEQSTTRQQHSSDIIDGDYSEVAPETDKIQTTSGWNKD
ncbi:MAG: FxsA family protein [Tateyamaria sp.]|nr:FxsA family protein [Tateyamaria sp.]